jgi:Major royal jelly protein
MKISRRLFLAGMGVVGMSVNETIGTALAADSELPLTIAAKSPWMANQVALTSKNVLFLGLPRYPDHDVTPSVARREPDGTVVAFPGNSWNDWKPGDDGQNAFVYVNSLHIFADDTVWCVDQGALRADAFPRELSTPKPGAQKLVQLDPNSGEVLNVLRFGDDILPSGAKMNDLRIDGSNVYVTDSGLGALIIHDMSTGKTLRRFSGYKEMMAVNPPNNQGQHQTPKSDMIEVSPDGAWLYWAAPTGPFRRIQTKLLRDPNMPDEELAKNIEHVADIERTGGCAMDTLGNLYLSELDNKRVTVLSPSGKRAVLVSDPEFISPDGSFISVDRHLYIPIPQSRRTRLFGNPTDMTKKPFLIYSVELPKIFDGIELGNPITGRPV